MSSSSLLLARARALAAAGSATVGALALIPAASIEAQVFTPESGAFYLTTSGIPTYAATAGVDIGGGPLADGAMKLWGDTGVKTKADFAFSQYVWWSDEPRTFYRDGVTLAWHGTFTGDLVGNHYVGDEWRTGDVVALDYEFTVDRTFLDASMGWELIFQFDGSMNTIASGTIEAGPASVYLSGTATGSNPLTWSETPQSYSAASWALYLVVSPWAYNVDSSWSAADSLRVTVPTHSIDVALNLPPGAITGPGAAVPEPSTWAAGAGAVAFIAAVGMRRRRR